MDGNFEKFKRKILREHLIKSLIYGCSFSVAFVSVASIFFKRFIGHVDVLIYMAVGILLSVASTYLIYRRFKPDDKKIAKRLDRKFSMNEKVQTMVEYRDREDELSLKQRENTENELKTISVKQLSTHFALMTVLTLILSLGICTSSLFVKERNRPFNPHPSESSVSGSEAVSSDPVAIGTSSPTENEKGIFDELIEAIDRSPLSDPTKEEIKEELGSLEDQLENAAEEEKDERIEQTKDRIDRMLEELLSKNRIGAELQKSSVEVLQKIGAALVNSDIDLLVSAFQMLKESLTGSDYGDFIALIDLYYEEIQTALLNSQVDSDDELYGCFRDLIDRLREVKTRSENQIVDIADAKKSVVSIIDEMLAKLIDLLTKQREIEALKEAIDEALDNLIPSSGEGDPGDEEGDGSENQGPTDGGGDEKNGDSDEKDGDKNDNPQGGSGEGEEVYGNNDQVYTKDGDTTEYGNVIDDYYSDIVNDGDEDIPEDIEDILNDYFNSLYGDGDDEGE